MAEGGSTIQLTNEKAWKNAAIVAVAALIMIYIISLAYPPLGTYTFNIMTVAAVFLGTSIGAIVISHLRGNLLIEAFIGASLAFGVTALVSTLLGAATSAEIGIIFAGNFVAILIVKGLLKKPL